MSTTETLSAPDFADVYSDHLERVWRFVRSRVPDHHEAHDVTSDVFVRAWRSWDRFDPGRGRVEPWLYTIAHRAVADWWRRRGPAEELLVEEQHHAPTPGPETETLQHELLAQLGSALQHLSQRERDGLALRFAARLSSEHIGRVLGTTAGAAKMMLHRSLQRLAADDLLELAATEPADLESTIDEILERGSTGVARSELSQLLLRIETAHSPELPSGLGDHVAFCVRCEVEGLLPGSASDGARDASPPARFRDGARDRSQIRVRPGGRGRVAALGASLVAFSGVCLACVVPAVSGLMAAIVGAAASYMLHLVGIAAAPLVVLVAWWGARRHGRSRGLAWTRAGLIVLAVHAAVHVALHVDAGAFSGQSAWWTLFTASDYLGTALLVWGSLLNLVDLSRWRDGQRSGVVARAAAA